MQRLVGEAGMSEPSYMNFWGKADAKAGTWHPLVYHMLDVAAVAREVTYQNNRFLNFWSEKLSLEREELLDTISFFAAVHDLGKFAADFQWKRSDLAQKLQFRTTNPPSFSHHMGAGWILWDQTDNGIHDLFINQLTPKPEGGYPSTITNSLKPLFSAAFGHHGAPVDTPPDYELAYKNIFECGEADAAKECLLALLDLFPVVKNLFKHQPDAKIRGNDFIAFSFVLSGLIILSDWTASAEENFEYVCNKTDLPANPMDKVKTEFDSLPTYFLHSQNLAKKAIEKQGLISTPVYRESNWERLFSGFAKKGYQPNPLQKQMLDMELPKSQALYILEDIAGSGKTEAALLLIGRLLSRNDANGFYFALPTMATSNGMYKRIAENYKAFFADNTDPSLILSHGSSYLHKEFANSILPQSINDNETMREPEESEYGATDLEYQSSKAACNAWFADRSKKVFLAEAGVGSVDQALLAAIYSRHNTLRLYGLSDRILVIDEVHAYDIYMQQLLNNLLCFQAAMGQSVILLSATLPFSMKQNLINAFNGDMGDIEIIEENETGVNAENEPYPLLTIAAREKETQCIPIAARKESMRTVSVSCITDEKSVLDILIETHNSGKCAVWIRNTVADVQNAYDMLLENMDPDKLMIFHSRFTMYDRQQVETDVLSMFGKDSGETERSGRILVASQVVEQSLDLDFDVMITDLCPVDLVIQRAGRLCRHSRDKKGNRLENKEGKDERGIPTLHLYGPDPELQFQEKITSEWYSSYFKGGAYVYADAGKLWLTAKVLKDAGKITMPDDARVLIESVYSNQKNLQVPDSLEQLSKEAIQKENTKESAGIRNCFPPEKGYIRPGDRDPFNEDERAVTRLSEDTFTYRLCLLQDGKLKPINEIEEYPWAMSEVKYRCLQLQYDSQIDKLREQTNKALFDHGRGRILIPLEIISNNGLAVDEADTPKTYRSIGNLEKGKKLIYDNKFGLRMEK
jgi:CRISPR-associated endonuclease/helicase Cas3